MSETINELLDKKVRGGVRHATFPYDHRKAEEEGFGPIKDPGTGKLYPDNSAQRVGYEAILKDAEIRHVKPHDPQNKHEGD